MIEKNSRQQHSYANNNQISVLLSSLHSQSFVITRWCIHCQMKRELWSVCLRFLSAGLAPVLILWSQTLGAWCGLVVSWPSLTCFHEVHETVAYPICHFLQRCLSVAYSTRVHSGLLHWSLYGLLVFAAYFGQELLLL